MPPLQLDPDVPEIFNDLLSALLAAILTLPPYDHIKPFIVGNICSALYGLLAYQSALYITIIFVYKEYLGFIAT